MWLAIFFGGIFLIIVHARYFAARMVGALELVVPALRGRLLWVRRLYLVVACSVPALALAYTVYLVLAVWLAEPGSFGPPRSRLYTYLIEYPFWLVTIYSVQHTILAAPLDLVCWLMRKRGIANDERWLRRKEGAVLVLAAVLLVYVPARVALDGRSLFVREHELRVASLPPALDGFRIVLVADMQADLNTGPRRLGQMVDAVNRTKADLVLIAGDLVTRDPEDIPLAAEYAGRLRAKHGVYACIGDHENFLYFRDQERSVQEVRAAVAARGVEMVDNAVRFVEVGSATLSVAFATNNYVTKIRRETVGWLFGKAQKADLQVALTHQPDRSVIVGAREAGIDLLLAGHTHGGQVRLWFPFVDLTAVRVETPYVTGAFGIGEMLLVVSSGLGVSVMPFRYRAPATVELIRLRAG